ncbi:hypothetical protein G9A89_017338 [Geosiphon pyriformis]|nr:hypothetical protein G9A89_017338 [Geosiphon pyriformis]
MEPVDLSAGGSGSGLAGLRTRQNVKNKRIDTVYSHGVSYKKPKKPAAGILVELSAGLLCLEDLAGNDGNLVTSWGSKMDSVSGSVSSLSDVKNLENMIAEETSYVDSDEDDKMNETTPRKTCTEMYVLEQPLKVPLFATMNDDDDNSVLPPPKISGSNQLPFSKSCVLKTSTPSKFPGVIHSTFTNEYSLIKARKMTVHKKIAVNSDLKKTNICSNWEVIVKKIPVDLPKLAVESVFSKFGKIVSIKMQLIGLWQKALIEFESSKVASLVTSKWSVLVRKDLVSLLYTLSVGTSAHDLSELLVSYGGKTCFIGCNLGSYICDQCAIICFENKDARLAAVSTVPIFKGISLHWASLVLASCTKYKQFGHITTNCSVSGSSGVCRKKVVSDQDRVHLAGIYKKKLAPIARPVLFGSKTWAQVASDISSHVSLSGSPGSGLCSGSVPLSAVSDHLVVFHLSDCLAVLECSLEVLADRVSSILIRLDSFGVVLLVLSSLAPSSVVSAALSSEVDSDMIVDNALSSSNITSLVTIDAVVDFSTSSSKVLTAKVGSLETKLVALEASVGLVLDKLNLLCSALGLSTSTSSQ